MTRGPRKIVVFDQRGALDRFVCSVLGEDRFFIFHADNYYEFEKILYTERPDIIIASAHIPQTDLVQIATLKQQSAPQANYPYVIIAVSRDIDLFLKMGVHQFANDVMIAPFYGIELMRKIHHADQALSQQTQIPAMAPVLSSPEVPSVHVRVTTKHSLPVGSTPTSSSNIVTRQTSVAFPKRAKPQLVTKTEMTSGVSRKRATILTIKINNFEKWVEELDQQDAINVVNQLNHHMNNDIQRLGGRIAATHGDVIVAVFHNTTMFPNHRMHALQAAMQLQLKSLFLSEILFKGRNAKPEILLSCALHSTMLTMMPIQSDPNHVTIIGTILPLAMRLLDQSQPGWIIATKDCYGEILQYIGIGEELILEDLNGNTALVIARITAANTMAFTYAGTEVFKVS